MKPILNFREKKQIKLDNIRKQMEDENVPLYKREQLVYKAWFLKNELHPRIFFDSANGTYRKRLNNGTK